MFRKIAVETVNQADAKTQRICSMKSCTDQGVSNEIEDIC